MSCAQIPTFSLFRRTSSLVAQPTTQGVSLRGIGPSGQSRTLVLLDGIPFNDPFGGWVYWTRVPLLSVDRIEVTDDTTSSLYGNSAMGGVINIVTTRPTRRTIEIKPQYGNLDSSEVRLLRQRPMEQGGCGGRGQLLQHRRLSDRRRSESAGRSTTTPTSTTGTSAPRLDYTPTDRINGFFRAAYFTENRNNGKVGELNDTKWTTDQRRRPGPAAGRERPSGARVRRRRAVSLQLPGGDQRGHDAEPRPPGDRPARADQRRRRHGAVVQGRSAARISSAPAATGDGSTATARRTRTWPPCPLSSSGVTQAATLSVQRVSGGTQQILGAFVQDIFTPVSKVVVTLSARVDRWRNYDGHNLETTVATGLPTVNNRPSIPERDDTVVSPRVAALYHVTDRVSVWGAANSGFRAPTLTELYRQFSVGAVTTRPNDQLGPGAPGRWRSRRQRRAGAQRHGPRHLVRQSHHQSGVERHARPPTLAQKQNLGATRVWGVQSDVEYRLGRRSGDSSGAYLYNQAKVTDGGAANAALVGKYLPQVPVHRGSLQVAYANPKYRNVALGMQFIGAQFNDDQNVNFIPVATLIDAGYDATPRPPGLPGYTHGRRHGVARHRAQPAGVLRRAEPVRPGVFRPDQSVDDSARRGWSTVASRVRVVSGRVARIAAGVERRAVSRPADNRLCDCD